MHVEETQFVGFPLGSKDLSLIHNYNRLLE